MKRQAEFRKPLMTVILMLSTMLIALPAHAGSTTLQSPASYATGTTLNPPSDPEQAIANDVTTGTTNDALCALFRTTNPGGGDDVADSEIYYDFSLAVPAGATIDGIEVVVSGYRTGPTSGPHAISGLIFNAYLSGDAGSSWTTFKSTSELTTTDAEYTLGGSTDLWNGIWTSSSFSNANFRLQIIPGGPLNTGEHWKLDGVQVRVYYTLADFEGLSHGYWKNHTEDWPPTGYSPSQTLASVFSESADLGLGGYTLLQALDFGGGPTLTDKAQLLLVQAVAAVLNAAHPDINYPLTVAQVVAQVNAALASEDVTTILALQGVLDGYNNLSDDVEP